MGTLACNSFIILLATTRSLTRGKLLLLICACACALPAAFAASDASTAPCSVTNHEAAKEVQSSKRSTANTVWWGFNEDDATDALQAAVRSGAKHVIGPNFSKDRMVCPLQLVSDQELVLEPGVTITAQRGAYRGGGRQHPQCRRVVRICEAKLASR